MRSGTTWKLIALALAAIALPALAFACGDDDKERTTAGPSPAAASTRVPGAESGGAAATGAVTIVMTDNKFSPENVPVKTNQEVTITADNRGEAVHNWHVLNVKDKNGKDIATQLLPAAKSETVKFTIDKSGTYDIQCDVHPADMRGKLNVQ